MKKVFVCSITNLAGQYVSPTTFEICSTQAESLVPTYRARIMIERNRPLRYKYNFGTIEVADDVAEQMVKQGFTIYETTP